VNPLKVFTVFIIWLIGVLAGFLTATLPSSPALMLLLGIISVAVAMIVAYVGEP